MEILKLEKRQHTLNLSCATGNATGVSITNWVIPFQIINTGYVNIPRLLINSTTPSVNGTWQNTIIWTKCCNC